MNIYIKALISTACRMIMNAKSGHTGMAISSAKINYSLFCNVINITNKNSKWINRDRFVLSAGHGSANLYALFYLSKVLSKDEILNFRHGCINTAGHPEYTKDNYIDASTGPLGQGIANAVGMAIAEKYMNNRWAKLKGLIDHYTYVLVGDGDLQEGISYEAMSIAGKLNLNKLIMIHDSNNYQLDSKVDLVNSENLKMRVESQGWIYISCENNEEEITKSIENAKLNSQPTFIEVKTIIGEGTSKQDSYKAHGLSINSDEFEQINKYYNMNFKDFDFEESIFDFYTSNVFNRGNQKYDKWLSLLEEYKIKYPELTNDLLNKINNKFEDYSTYFDLDDIVNNQPTKTYLKNFFDQLNDVKDIITLSADLASTTNCKLTNNNKSFNEDVNSGYVMVGIREFAMGAIQNGILLHNGLKSFAGTFLVFSDYIKPAIRVGAMCNLPSNYIFTHDSYLVGNDGPTHQPYDQIPMLRSIENVYLLRPCDQNETFASINMMLNNTDKTYCLCLTRQNILSFEKSSIEKTYNGAYILKNIIDPDLTIIASGSEVQLAMDVSDKLKEIFNMNVKVVSCPSLKIFLSQPKDYIHNILKSNEGLVCIEASNDYYWYELSKYINKIFLIKASKFGFSDDGIKVYQKNGFNIFSIVNKIKDFINGTKN